MSHAAQPEKPNVSSSAALWAAVIFVGLLIAAINFVQAESKSEGHGGHGAATEHHEAGAYDAAPAQGTPAEEGHGTAAPAAHEDAAHETQHAAPAAGAAHEEAHH